MITEKTKETLCLTAAIIGSVLLFGGITCDIITDWSNVIPDSDWYRMAIAIGWPIGTIALTLKEITQKDVKFGTFYWGAFVIILPFIWFFQINDYTVPIIVSIVISAILAVIAIILTHKRNAKIKALQKEQEEKDN